jgi:hypothetical protein
MSSLLLIILRQNASMRTTLRKMEEHMLKIANNVGRLQIDNSPAFHFQPLKNQEEYDCFVESLNDTTFRRHMVSNILELYYVIIFYIF